MPGEVGRVGVESPTFIEPVQKRKDGIEAMFMRQAKAKETASSSSSAPAAVGTGRTGNKRKHEPSSSPSPSPAEVKDETRTPVTSPPPPPAKRVKPDKKWDHPIKPMEIVDVDAGEPAEDDKSSSDVEILSSLGPSSSQPVIVPLPLILSLSHATYEFLFQRSQSQSQRRRKMSETIHHCYQVRSNRSYLPPK